MLGAAGVEWPSLRIATFLIYLQRPFMQKDTRILACMSFLLHCFFAAIKTMRI